MGRRQGQGQGSSGRDQGLTTICLREPACACPSRIPFERGRPSSVGAGWSSGLHAIWLRAIGLAVAFVLSPAESVRAQALASPSAAEICLAANRHVSVGAALPRTAARLKSGAPLRVVAVGSSSTTGLWMLTPGATYPEVMRRELVALQPGASVEIVNSGRVGDTIGGMLARFESDVLAYQPDLVVWQLGTNDVAWGITWGGRADALRDQVIGGVRMLKTSATDVILMDLQYAPLVLASSHHPAMQAVIAETSRHERVGLFSRFDLMRRSIDAGLPRARWCHGTGCTTPPPATTASVERWPGPCTPGAELRPGSVFLYRVDSRRTGRPIASEQSRTSMLPTSHPGCLDAQFGSLCIASNTLVNF